MIYVRVRTEPRIGVYTATASCSDCSLRVIVTAELEGEEQPNDLADRVRGSFDILRSEHASCRRAGGCGGT